MLAEAGASTAAGAHLLLHKRLVCSEKAAKGSSVQVPQGVPLLWRGGPVRSRLGHTHLLTCRPPIRLCQDWACRGAKQARPYQSSAPVSKHSKATGLPRPAERSS